MLYALPTAGLIMLGAKAPRRVCTLGAYGTSLEEYTTSHTGCVVCTFSTTLLWAYFSAQQVVVVELIIRRETAGFEPYT